MPVLYYERAYINGNTSKTFGLEGRIRTLILYVCVYMYVYKSAKCKYCVEHGNMSLKLRAKKGKAAPIGAEGT